MGAPLQKLALAEFLAWEEQQPERYEFYRGEPFAMVGGTARHNRVILNLASRISLGKKHDLTPSLGQDRTGCRDPGQGRSWGPGKKKDLTLTLC